MVTYTTTVQQSGDEYYIELPQELWDSLGWKVGDTVEWTQADNNSWLIRKKDESSTLHNGL